MVETLLDWWRHRRLYTLNIRPNLKGYRVLYTTICVDPGSKRVPIRLELSMTSILWFILAAVAGAVILAISFAPY